MKQTCCSSAHNPHSVSAVYAWLELFKNHPNKVVCD